jgi:hypothetical protein
VCSIHKPEEPPHPLESLDLSGTVSVIWVEILAERGPGLSWVGGRDGGRWGALMAEAAVIMHGNILPIHW